MCFSSRVHLHGFVPSACVHDLYMQSRIQYVHVYVPTLSIKNILPQEALNGLLYYSIWTND